MRALFILLSLCIASLAYGQQAKAPRSDESKKQPVQDQRGTRQQPLVIETAPTPVDEAEARDQRNHRAQQTAIGSAVRESLKDLVHEAEKTWVLTLALSVATALLAVITWMLVWSAERTAKRQLRAYVALDDIYFPWVPKIRDPGNRQQIIKGEQVKVRIKNFGQTPAMNITLRLGGTYAGKEGKFERMFGGKDYVGPRLMLSPTQSYATRVSRERFVFNGNKPVDPDGNEPFVFGAIIYQDIFKRWWTTHFCYHYDIDPKSKNRFIPHSQYNYEKLHWSEGTAKKSLRYDPNILGTYRGEQAGGMETAG